ncbi:NACHT and WD40 domain protein [Penicillium frequentans]|nr:NACHT and WD40 domain protein [Penicillium glabrum]
MASKISFGSSNYGSEIGINYGSVKNEFHHSLDLDKIIPIVPGAMFDSYADQHKDKCLSGTRTDIINQIKRWASAESSPHGKCIFWLNGIAGTGKSTISRTMAEFFNQNRSLGASFFFERGDGDRGNAKKLIPTIARQLAIRIPQMMPALQEIARGDPGIAAKTMREQFKRLLVQPLQRLKKSVLSAQTLSIQTMVIVIDALDECEGDDDIRLILQLLPGLQNLAALRLRVLLTSRPDLPVRLGFSRIASDDHKDLILHDIPEEVIAHDIAIFLDHRLAEVKTQRSLPTNWPCYRDFQKLVALSVPLFIFAATICRLFEDSIWDPAESLAEILTHQNDESQLDSTYLPVLDRLLYGQLGKQRDKLISEFQQVIGAIVILESPLSVISLAKLLGLSKGLIQRRLNPLHSVLRVPDDETIPVRLFHLSFRDFLLDPETRQKTPFGVNEIEIHYILTRKCLLKCHDLLKNICELPSEGTETIEIDRETIDAHLPPELQYACRYWVYHLIRCTNCADFEKITQDAFVLLRTHLLHWIEAMSLLDLTSEILGILDRFQAAIPGDGFSIILDFLHDAKRFVRKNSQIIDQAPLQVYCAGLIFAPQASIIRNEFQHEFPTWICRLPEVKEEWDTELQILEGHSRDVCSVVFSPDGLMLASGSPDGTVRLWNPYTGALTHILEDNSTQVLSVAFSPNGCLLASGSLNGIVSLWDLSTGAGPQYLEGHSDQVWSVAFSPDSQLLASGSYDKSVYVWDVVTGALTQIFEGDKGRVQSVAFSLDGRLLASGSRDKSVHLWDIATGALRQTLKGHTSEVRSVVFSPDGRLLASGSSDGTVRLWDPVTGVLTHCLEDHSSVTSVAFLPNSLILASSSLDVVQLWDLATGIGTQTLGHSGVPLSVAFSPISQLLATGSADKTVRLWDLKKDALPYNVKGDRIWSVAFSPDGRLLASGSTEDLVHLWDPTIGAITRTLRGHSSQVRSVIFSPDGRLLASGSEDKTVCLWDPTTGTLMQTLRGHSDSIRSVAFSPDSQILASGSQDRTVRLWDLATGVVTCTLERHLGAVSSVMFSPNGRLLASSSFHDNTICMWDAVTGVFMRTWELDEGDLVLGFSQNGSHIRTKFGAIYIQSGRKLPATHSSRAYPRISIEHEQWIQLNGEKVLWLPVEFRPDYTRALMDFQIKGNMVALGLSSGRVSFLELYL